MKVYRDYTTADLEVQYNNRARVPEHPQIFARWQARSRAFRATVEYLPDLAYGSGEREVLDLFLCGRPDTPLQLFIHGGYWQAMDKHYFSFLAEALVDQGINVAVLNYGLCPTVSLDHIVTQLRLACIWLWRHAGEYGIDPGRLQVCGHSAGGHLCAMLMSTQWPELAEDLPSDLIKSGVAVSGLFDLEPLRHTPINQALDLDEDVARRNSPVFLMAAVPSPLLLAVGGLESVEYHRQSRDLAASWGAQGVPVELLDLPGLNHFTIVDELAQLDSTLLTKALALL